MPPVPYLIPFIPRKKLITLSLFRQTGIYLASFLLPPLGLIWGFRYLKNNDQKVKIVGLVAILLTVVSLIITVWLSLYLMNTLTQSFDIDKDLQELGY
ncbi:MAG: hypothetical protein Q7S03_02465 [bacterium]|nr:hypothetical protein [bacterium]